MTSTSTTEAGKQRSVLNALRHGLAGQTIILPSDDLAAYERPCKDFFLEYEPKAATETFLVPTIADTRGPSIASPAWKTISSPWESPGTKPASTPITPKSSPA